MTETLSPEAAADYLRLTLYSYETGLIGQSHFAARLKLLRSLAGAQSGAATFAEELLGDGDQGEEEPWSDGEARGSDPQGPVETSGPYIDDADNSLAFKVVSGPLKGWEFHQADDDFFPSIPHGHEHGRKQPKLDVYLGWIYRKERQIDRADRASIVKLWNDREFREFARIAIDYYLDHFPNYSGWRVSDPRILPVIRRGRRYR